MNKLLLIVLFLFLTRTCFAQKDKDTLISNLPMINGSLVYTDSIKVKDHSRIMLDSTAKKWLNSYFKYHRPDTLSKDKDPESSVLSQGLLEFRMTTTSLALVKYNFYVVIKIKINCTENNYAYRISDIYFVPKSKFFRAVGYYQSSPEYMIGLLNKKHLGIVDGMNMGRKKIREYITRTNDAVQACITSLNTAMAN
ncbi:MAG: hypothetical protein JWQ63_3186 [Mucilaginibacter sp.]|nr:hypothetical protein [Mucilaginibacter sp.]